MGRSPCCAKEGMNRGAWTAAEDELLIDCISHHGEGKWRRIPKLAGLKRCGKSCRLRWLNYLRPDIKRGNILPEEEDLIVRLHRLLGNRWSLIAGRLPGRTDNEIKNYWNTTLSKKAVVQQGNASSNQTTASMPKRKKKLATRTPTSSIIPSTLDRLPVADQTTTTQVVRTKAVRCTKVFITNTTPNNAPLLPVPHHQAEPPRTFHNYESLGPDQASTSWDQNAGFHNNNDNMVAAGDNNLWNARDECLSVTSSGEGGNLSMEDFPMDFHEVLGAAEDEMGSPDSDFWRLLNDWIMDEGQ